MGVANSTARSGAESQADGADSMLERVFTIAASEAPERFGELLDRVIGGERVGVTRYGKLKVVWVDARDYARFLEFERIAAASAP